MTPEEQHEELRRGTAVLVNRGGLGVGEGAGSRIALTPVRPGSARTDPAAGGWTAMALRERGSGDDR